MTRKEFITTSMGGLFGSLLLFLGFGCSSSESPEMPGNEQSFTSSSTQNHTHTVTLQQSEVENPPQGGIARNTSSSAGHSHSFSMTQQQLQNVNSGQTVTVTDSTVSGHNHQYQISKWF